MPVPRPTADDRELVVLRVPADARYARVLRIAVSAYAVRLGLAPAAVEDLRLAVDESLILLMGPTAPEQVDAGADPVASIVLTLNASGDRPPVSIELHLDPAPTQGEADASALSRFEEIVPAAVGIDAVDQLIGRVALRHPS